VVVLDEIQVDPELAPGVIAVGLDEKAAVVAEDLGLDHDQALEPALDALGHQLSARPYWRS
jgi:hypothetical protein